MSYITRNNFSYTRFTMLLKREFITNRQHLMLQGLVLIGIMIAVEALVTYTFYSEWKLSNIYYGSNIPSDTSSHIIAYMWIMGLFLFSSVMASFTCNNLATKASRVNALMITGTPLEKYLSRALPYTIGFFIFYCCAAGVVDMFRCLYIEFTTPVHPTFLYKRFILSYNKELFMGLLASFLTTQAFFTMVSAFAPKYTFIKGCCILFIIYLALLTLTIGLPIFIPNGFSEPDILFYIYCTAAIVFSVAMHIVAYYRYKETDIQ